MIYIVALHQNQFSDFLFQLLTCVGAVGSVLSIMMISLCREFWQFLLAQGVLLGISMSLVSWPMLALVAKSVNPKNRAAAMGIVLGGSSLGGILWPIAIDQMLKNPRLGFPWTMRIVGFIMIPLFMVPCAVASTPPPPPAPTSTGPVTISDSETEVSAREDHVECGKHDSEKQAKVSEAKVDLKEERRKLFKKPAMWFLCLALFFTYFGMFSPFFYVTSYAVAKGFSSSLAFYTISIVNGASFFGRVLPGVLADKYGKFNLIIISTLFAGIIAMCWTKVTSVAGLVIWCASYGFASGVSSTSPLLRCSLRTLANDHRESFRFNKPALHKFPAHTLWALPLALLLVQLLSRTYHPLACVTVTPTNFFQRHGQHSDQRCTCSPPWLDRDRHVLWNSVAPRCRSAHSRSSVSESPPVCGCLICSDLEILLIFMQPCSYQSLRPVSYS